MKSGRSCCRSPAAGVQPYLLVICCLLLVPSSSPYPVDVVSFAWREITSSLHFPGILRESFLYDTDLTTDTLYVFGGVNSIATGTFQTQYLPLDLWAFRAVAGTSSLNGTWTELTQLLTGSAGAPPPMMTTLGNGAIYKSRFYNMFGRLDTDLFFDQIGAVWADPMVITVYDLRTPYTRIPVSTRPMTLGPPSRNAPPLNQSVLTPRFSGQHVLIGSRLYIFGGVSGVLNSRGAATGGDYGTFTGTGYGAFTDSFIVIDLDTAVATRLATAGGPSAPAVAPDGALRCVVFSGRSGTRVHVWGGVDYAAADVLDPTTLYTYDIASDTWSSTPINAKQGVGYTNYLVVDNGALVYGGDSQPILSGAGLGDTNRAFLIDASLDPPLIRNLAATTLTREDAGVAIFRNGMGMAFLGASYPNMGSTVAFRYHGETQAFVAFVPFSGGGRAAAAAAAWAVAAAAAMIVL